MFAAVLTAVLYAMSSITSARAARLIGPIQASVTRLVIATTVLALYAFTLGQGLQGPGLPVFLLSGVIGFGIGDIALFHAYHKLGARLAILLAQCLAVPFAAAIEWRWLGTTLTHQLPWIFVVLVGVLMALLPSKTELAARVHSVGGIAFGIVAALGQAAGAVLSRRAISVNTSAHVHINAATASFQRILAGMAVSVCILLLMERIRKRRVVPPAGGTGMARWIVPLCLANAIFGPILGVSCYQWALTAAPSGVVLAIVATTPIVVLPMTWVMEDDRPTLVSVAGSVIAIGGVIGLLMG